MLDKFDQQIIEQLSLNARQSVSHIAELVNLSRSAVTERIKKLENQGVIKGYQVLLGESQKPEFSAYLEIRHCCSRCKDVVDIFKTIPEVKTCHGISGEMDLLVFVQTDSMKRLHAIREMLDAEADIDRIRTHIVMSEWISQ